MIARHDGDGRLPAGIHEATWDELVARFGGTAHRAEILARVRVALLHLHEAGSPSVLIGGSFVTTKEQPGDIDVVWSVQGVDVDALHPVFRGPDGLPAIKALFSADMFPSMLIEAATGLPFEEFFQQTTEGRPVGAVKLDLSTIPEDD